VHHIAAQFACIELETQQVREKCVLVTNQETPAQNLSKIDAGPANLYFAA